MAKPLMVTLGQETFSFAINKIERSDLYGARKRVPLDAEGNSCTRASLTQDGQLLIASGMSGQGYFDDQDKFVPRSSLVGVAPDGSIVESKPSTLGIAQALRGPVEASRVLDLELLSVYRLNPEQTEGTLLNRLKSGEIFECDFNYTSSLEVERSFLIANDQGYFALVGKPFSVEWVQEGESFTPPIDAAQAEDDLDFEML